MPNQNQNAKDFEREAALRPDYDKSDQSMHAQEIAKGFKGQGQKQKQQQSGAGRRDNK